jgi:hypothetical protein
MARKIREKAIPFGGFKKSRNDAHLSMKDGSKTVFFIFGCSVIIVNVY